MIKSSDIISASDDELADIFPRIDGAFSRQTRALMASFKTDLLDLNDNWASVPPFWCCPACKRSKPQLARLSDQGVLLCHLDLHHDHLRDASRAILRARNPLPEAIGDPERGALMRAFSACKGLLERFCDALICKDCNQADGEAKLQLKAIPRVFSFSPVEIGKFITARPNQAHTVLPDVAMALWEAVEEDVKDRLEFAHLLAERIAQGRHRRQGEPPSRSDMGRTNGEIALRLLAHQTGSSFYNLSTLLGDRSVRRDGFALMRKRNRVASKTVRAPTPEEWAELDARQARTSGWRQAPSDWCCPVCARDRAAIPRRSNANKWTGSLHHLMVFQLEADPEVQSWRRAHSEADVFRSHGWVWICQDCRQIQTDVKTADPTLEGHFFSVKALRNLVGEAKPHVRHEVDLEKAMATAVWYTDRDEAALEYFEHKSRCTDLWSRYQFARKELDLDAKAAEHWVGAWFTAPCQWTSFDVQLAWSLTEGERFYRFEEERYVPDEAWV